MNVSGDLFLKDASLSTHEDDFLYLTKDATSTFKSSKEDSYFKDISSDQFPKDPPFKSKSTKRDTFLLSKEALPNSAKHDTLSEGSPSKSRSTGRTSRNSWYSDSPTDEEFLYGPNNSRTSQFNFTWPIRNLVSELEGQITLGALHMVHERSEEMVCGKIMPQGGIQALETMLYTLDYVNGEGRWAGSGQRVMPPGVRLGVMAKDDCDRDIFGLEQAVDFIKGSITSIGGSSYRCPDGSQPENEVKIISGVLGAPSSVTSIQVHNLLKLFKIPQISFFSTSPTLSNRERFPYFLRTIPSDVYQAEVMVALVKKLGWTYISVVYEESSYGILGFNEVEKLLKENDICLATTEKLLKDSGQATDADYDVIVARLLKKGHARGVIIFGSDQEVGELMKAVGRRGKEGTFAWIGSDGWGGRGLAFKGKEEAVEGAITVQPLAEEVQGFRDYFLSLRPATNTRNPWFIEYWEQHFGCKYPGSAQTPFNQKYEKTCTGEEQISGNNGFEMEAQLQFVSDGVLAFAHAYKNSTPQFKVNETMHPESVCSKPCGRRQYVQPFPGDPCCWTCKDCLMYQYLPSKIKCEECPYGTVPSYNMSTCIAIPQVYLHYTDAIALAAMTLASLGILATSFVVVLFLRYKDTPVVKASGLELCFVLLFGILLCYTMTFLLVSKPTVVTCGVQKVGLGLCFSICYSAILTKTNRIARIFRAGKRTAKRPKFISPESQLIICGSIVGGEVIVSLVWLLISPPNAVPFYSNRADHQLVCHEAVGFSYMIGLAYPILLVIVCTVYAILTRKIPEAFNESKHIGFTMYTTCIIWAAFVVIYLSTAHSIQIRIATMCFSISLSATVALICMFLPKTHLILFRPERNVRQSMLKTTSGGGGTSPGGGGGGGSNYSTTGTTYLSKSNNSSCARIDSGTISDDMEMTQRLRASGSFSSAFSTSATQTYCSNGNSISTQTLDSMERDFDDDDVEL
ncbi:metabotropic glutamate receptor 3-like [Littorina saxatilis]|uniref:metabotropic glutamate receptor 3-like n=1 Tax=Littorina saxatilis TaxID=31220 RepID=UPI0038B67418